MVSVVIRNKNEEQSLLKMFPILIGNYSEYIDELILVDNCSTDNSVEVAKKYGCKIVNIDDFTYGKAINLGLSVAKNQYVLLLSSHAIPVGRLFFKSALDELRSNSKIAGIRFLSSFSDYLRSHKDNYLVNTPLKFGLMAACAMVNKEAWQHNKFDENLEFSEDKEWSKRVCDAGYIIKSVPETFFYFAKRDNNSNIKRWENETLAHHKIHGVKFSSFLEIIMTFFYKITVGNFKEILSRSSYHYKIFLSKLRVRKALKNS